MYSSCQERGGNLAVFNESDAPLPATQGSLDLPVIQCAEILTLVELELQNRACTINCGLAGTVERPAGVMNGNRHCQRTNLGHAKSVGQATM
jgi:hypothetical protein